MNGDKVLPGNFQNPTDNWETDGGSSTPMEMPAVLQDVRAIPAVAFVAFDRMAHLSMRAKIRAHLESLNRRLLEMFNRLIAIVEEAEVRLGGAKARRWVRIARHPSSALWTAFPQRWEARELLSDADLYAARGKPDSGPSRADASEHP